MTTSDIQFPINDRSMKSSVFWVMVRKEIADYIRSWQFLVMLALIVFIFFGSMYVSLSNLEQSAIKVKNLDDYLLYLRLLTTTDGNLPSFHIFMSFLAPLLGICLGFNSINSEHQNGTLIKVMAQPVYRDNLLLSKFISATVLTSALFISLALLMIGGGMIITGVSIEFEEFLRICIYILICVFYVSFWYGLSMIFSIRFKQASTAAIASIGVWLFFTIIYGIIINAIASILAPNSNSLIMNRPSWILDLIRMAPSQLYTDATTTLLMPKIRSLGPMNIEQMAGSIPSPLPLWDSLMIVWPQVSGLISATIICFALAYYLFMRKEIKS